MQTSFSHLRPSMRDGGGGTWIVGFVSAYTGSWVETVATYSNRGQAVARYRGLLKTWSDADLPE